MDGISSKAAVNRQYSSSGNLNTRISIHDKYSTNKTGFGSWIVSNYRIEKGMTVLELGCGTGSMWKGHDDLIGLCSKLVLSDFSEGMLGTAAQNIGPHENVEYRVIDIQDIPYEDDAFDIVIANMMLYHVPDRDKGLSEVRRVLRNGGTFYAATYGEYGIMEHLTSLLSCYGVSDGTDKSFTLQNGADLLGKYFSDVKRWDYEDSLAVTDVDDIIDYICSLSGMTALCAIPREDIRRVLVSNMKDGVLHIPKEYGMFTAI